MQCKSTCTKPDQVWIPSRNDHWCREWYSTQLAYVVLRPERVMYVCLLCACALIESFGDDLIRSNILDKVGPYT